MMQQKARISVKTFWNQKRVDAGFTMQELSEGLGIDYTRLSHYLTGQDMPPPIIALKLCDLFDVNPDEGTAEFTKAHEQWVINRKRAKFTLAEPKIEPEPTPEPTPEPKPEPINDELMKSLYGLLSYENFKAVLLTGIIGSDVLAEIYGKADYDTYLAISNLIK